MASYPRGGLYPSWIDLSDVDMNQDVDWASPVATLTMGPEKYGWPVGDNKLKVSDQFERRV